MVTHFSWRVGIFNKWFQRCGGSWWWQLSGVTGMAEGKLEEMRSRTDRTASCGKGSPPGHWRRQEWVGQKKDQDPGSDAFPEKGRGSEENWNKKGWIARWQGSQRRWGRYEDARFMFIAQAVPWDLDSQNNPLETFSLCDAKAFPTQRIPGQAHRISLQTHLSSYRLSVNDLPPTHPNQKPGDHSRVLPLPHHIIISWTCFNPPPLLLCTLFQASTTSHQFLCLVPLTRLPASGLSPWNPLSSTSGNHSSVGWIWNHSLHKKPIMKYLLCLSDSWIWKWIPEASRMGG